MNMIKLMRAKMDVPGKSNKFSKQAQEILFYF